MTNDVDAMFTADSDNFNAKIQVMAEWLAEEDETIAVFEKALIKQKAVRDATKTQLAELMQQNGMESVKLDNGLSPAARIVTKIFKAAGIENETVHQWLKDNDLGDIIKPTVHFQTLSATLKEYKDQGNELPDIFNVSSTPTVTLFGKSKYLLNKGKT